MLLVGWVLLSASASTHAQTPKLEVNILYIEQRVERAPVLSNLVAWPDDDGMQGAALGLADNNATGRFVGQEYSMDTLIFDVDEPANARNTLIREKLAEGAQLAVLNMPAADMLEIAAMPEAADDLLFNAQSADVELRNEECQSNILHTIPSRAMLSDALIQFFVLRKWKQIFLIEGNRSADGAYANAMRNSIKKFGLKIVEDRNWVVDADMRRNASLEVPVFTQSKKYDAVIVTDEDQDFSQYILYNTWLPRPVSGSAGLVPVAWSPVIEQWGAAQLQSRFRKLADRDMTGRDYANWAAIRAVGEAVTRLSLIHISEPTRPY